MVFWASDQMDEDSLKVKACVERTLAEMSKPAEDLLTIVQEGAPSDPIVRIRTPHGDRSMRVARQLLYEQSEEWLCAQLRLRLEWMYRRPASVA